MTVDTTELRRLHGAATAGEWQAERDDSDWPAFRPWIGVLDDNCYAAMSCGETRAEALNNAAAIVAFKNAIPQLCDAADRLARIEAVLVGDEALKAVWRVMISELDMVSADAMKASRAALAALRELIGGV